MIKDEEYLERIVAGIHSVTTAKAEVVWNETLNGRQFDVVVRFKIGTLSYLVLVEVKNRTRRASASDLDAFVSKARDQNANKTVFVTAAGFQEGAITVAKRHGVELFTVMFDENELTIPSAASMFSRRNPDAPADMEPEFSIGEPELAAAISAVRITYSDGQRATIPDESSQMTYYMQKTNFSDGRSLETIVHSIPIYELREGQKIVQRTKFSPPLRMTPPDAYFFSGGSVETLEWDIHGEMRRPIRGNIRIDPSVFASPVVYKNAITGEEMRFTLDKLPLGMSEAKQGRFYFAYHPLVYYYCDFVSDDEIRWIIVESFQAGQLLRATYTQDIAWAQSYIPVTDKSILERLKNRLADYRRLQERDRKLGGP